ncbi:hypothetical protein KKB18_13005 [bacterium]|nr:hypothetical protein [bacterium]
MKRKWQLIRKFFRINLILSAMFLLVVRSILYSFFPHDYKHIFLTAAVLGLLFLFFNARVELKRVAKSFLMIVFLITVFLMIYIPNRKMSFDYLLTLKDDDVTVTINIKGSDRQEALFFSSGFSMDGSNFQVVGENNKKVEFFIFENHDNLLLVKYFIKIDNKKKDVTIKYKITNNPAYLNKILIFPDPRVDHIGTFKIKDESEKLNIYTELPLENQVFNLADRGMKNLKYSIILIDTDFQVIDLDQIGRWRLVCKKDYINRNLLNFLGQTQINLKQLFGYSFPLDIIVRDSLITVTHERRGERTLILLKQKDIAKYKTIIHELFHSYHINLRYNTLNEGITEFFAHTYSKEFGISTQKDFENTFLEYYADYYNYPYALEKSISEINELGWKWTINDLSYSKGFLISLIIDKKLEKLDKNLSLYDFIVKYIPRKKYINDEKLISLLNKYSHSEFKFILDDYIRSWKKIEPEDCIDTSKYRINRIPSCVTFMGIRGQFETFDIMKVLEILDNSPFMGIDLKVGDEIIESGTESREKTEPSLENRVILNDTQKYGNCFWTGIWNKDDLVFIKIKREDGVKKVVVKPVCVPGTELTIEKRGIE